MFDSKIVRIGPESTETAWFAIKHYVAQMIKNRHLKASEAPVSWSMKTILFLINLDLTFLQAVVKI